MLHSFHVEVKNEQWEYKIVKVAGTDAEVMADFGTLVFADQTSMLNKMGKDGWELVSTYTETGISFPSLTVGNFSMLLSIDTTKNDENNFEVSNLG